MVGVLELKVKRGVGAAGLDMGQRHVKTSYFGGAADASRSRIAATVGSQREQWAGRTEKQLQPGAPSRRQEMHRARSGSKGRGESWWRRGKKQQGSKQVVRFDCVGEYDRLHTIPRAVCRSTRGAPLQAGAQTWSDKLELPLQLGLAHASAPLLQLGESAVPKTRVHATLSGRFLGQTTCLLSAPLLKW